MEHEVRLATHDPSGRLRATLPALAFAALMALGAPAVLALADEGGGYDVEEVREATAAFHLIPVAEAAGYALVPGLDYCFDNPGVGGMGYHYINVSFLNASLLDPERPEALVYARGRNGRLRLVAVEYIVPAATWDATHQGPPALAGQTLHLDQALGVYVLHAWIWFRNPLGMFEDWNPDVTCP